jgi:hypothetical protein
MVMRIRKKLLFSIVALACAGPSAAAIGEAIGKYHHFPQEALRERLHRQQVLERDPFQAEESGRFVGELAVRQAGMLPKLVVKRAFRMVAAPG